MEIALISDAVTSSHGLGYTLRRDSSASNSQISISAAMFTVDALARPPVKSNPRRSATTLLRRRRRTKRRSLSGGGDDDEDGGYGSVGDWFFGGEGPVFGGGDGDGGSGFFGGGGGGGGGKGWNFGGRNWESSPPPPSDPAFDFVYEVVSWIVLSNCVHFAFKKVLRAFAGEEEREKVVPIRLTSVC